MTGPHGTEFYTNRTLVHLMAQMLEPKAGETIYDPTCGTGGMLISCLAEVKRNGGDTRTIGLYGQELINITAAIARMNLVLHGVSDFDIRSGNTLHDPALIEGDRLKTFDVVLANPPYSIKKWNREAWQSDPWGAPSSEHLRRVVPTTRTSSTTSRAWIRRQEGVPSSIRWGAFRPEEKEMRISSSSAIWSKRWDSARSCSTTHQWKRALSLPRSKAEERKGRFSIHAVEVHKEARASLARTPISHPEGVPDFQTSPASQLLSVRELLANGTLSIRLRERGIDDHGRKVSLEMECV